MLGWSRSLRILTSLRSCDKTACRCFGSPAKVCFSITFTAKGHSSRRRTARNTLDAVCHFVKKKKENKRAKVKHRSEKKLFISTLMPFVTEQISYAGRKHTQAQLLEQMETYWCLRRFVASTRSGHQVQLARSYVPIHPKCLPANYKLEGNEKK